MRNMQSIIELSVSETDLISGGWDWEFRNGGCRDPKGQINCMALCDAHPTFVDPHGFVCKNNCYLVYCVQRVKSKDDKDESEEFKILL